MDTVSKSVESLIPGNKVDLASCPFLAGHASAASEFAVVESVERENADCFCVAYEGIDHVGYPAGTILKVYQPKDVPDPAIMVRAIERPGEFSEWNISLNLTDRWGDLNYHDSENKPLELLENDQTLLDRLREQMCEETTFVARKDGKFGLLFEVEFCSRESEEGSGDPAQAAQRKPHDKVVKALIEGMTNLAKDFPGVAFAVPDESNVVNDRPAAWAFIEDGLLNETKRKALAIALSDL